MGTLGLSASKVFGGLADLPVAIDKRVVDRSLDLGSFERGEREHGATAHGGFVGTRRKDRREAALVADRTERCHRGLAHERLGSGSGQLDETLDDLVAA